jgi:hypothetical protein
VPNYVGSFKLSFFRNAASIAMTADTDLSLVPDEYVNALIWKAAAIGLTGKGADDPGRPARADGE